jgi:hypothetical protein
VIGVVIAIVGVTGASAWPSRLTVFTPRAPIARLVAVPPALRPSLRHELRQVKKQLQAFTPRLISPRFFAPRAVVPPRLGSPGGATCFVGSRCSLNPCIVTAGPVVASLVTAATASTVNRPSAACTHLPKAVPIQFGELTPDASSTK